MSEAYRFSSPPLEELSQDQLEDRRSVARAAPPERRQEGRQRTILTGLVIFPGDETGRTVTILNRSIHGAKLKLGDVGLVPQTFTLIDQKAGLAHACRVVWKLIPHVGVQFERSLDLNEQDQKLNRQLQSLWGGSKS